MVVLTALRHGALGGWDEVVMLGLSVAIGIVLAMVLGKSKKSG